MVAECKDGEATEVLQHIAKINEKELPYDLNLEDNRIKHTDDEVKVNTVSVTLTQPAFLYPYSNHPGSFRPDFTFIIVIGTWLANIPNTNN